MRSDSVLPPLLVLPLPCVRGVRPPRMVGSLLSASAVSLGVVFASSAMSTVVSGVGDRALSVMVRDPVTVMTPISSPVSTWAPCEPWSAVCAHAELAAMAAPTPSATRVTRRISFEIITPPFF